MPKHLVISTSGNPDSNSRRMGRAAFAHLQKKEVDCDWIDIREMDLPLCDADKCYGMPGSKKLSTSIEHADGILSPQTWSQRLGLDYEQEQANITAHAGRSGKPALRAEKPAEIDAEALPLDVTAEPIRVTATWCHWVPWSTSAIPAGRSR